MSGGMTTRLGASLGCGYPEGGTGGMTTRLSVSRVIGRAGRVGRAMPTRRRRLGAPRAPRARKRAGAGR